MKTFAPNQLDFYKVGHIRQYPDGTEYVYSNLTARSGNHSNIPNSKGVIWMGNQLFILEFLIDEWNNTFFNKPKAQVVEKFRLRVSTALGQDVDVKHMEDLHDLGYLPIHIKALPEGTFVPYKVAMMTIVNTHPNFGWITNALESVISTELWIMINSATTFKEFNKNFTKYANITCDSTDHVSIQGHDFSFRGMEGRQASAKSAFAVLACGSTGTDTVPALDIAEDYYGIEPGEFVAGSVNATEHSVMCAGSLNGEFDTFKRLLTEVYPTGVVSIVSDTWDLWKVVDDFLPRLKHKIENREGTLIIRPDSGDPVDIICGTTGSWNGKNPPKKTSEEKGLIVRLWEIFGGTINSKGYKVLNPCIGAIYGESITLERQQQILQRLKIKGFASSNIFLGLGSYAFQHTTRDTHGIAIKATSVVINGERKDIFKDPKTDSGLKKSAKGLLQVYKDEKGQLAMKDECTEEEEGLGELKTVFLNGVLVNRVTLHDIRKITAL